MDEYILKTRTHISVFTETRQKVRLLAAILGVSMAAVAELAVAKLLAESTPSNAPKDRPNDRA